MKYAHTINFIRSLFKSDGLIPLHEPFFGGNEKEYLLECIDSNFVSSVGKYVDQFENLIAEFTQAQYAVATVNGTSALHIALILAGVNRNDEVITQPVTFVATCNAINYIGATPVFLDVDRETLGLSSEKLEQYLRNNTTLKNGECINNKTGRRIKAIVPMHTFGLPADIVSICEIAKSYGLTIVEDAAESLGSYVNRKHTGTFGLCGILSFNGNKTLTTGGGGMILTNDNKLAEKAKHLTTTAKVAHQWNYFHDEIGFNYRLPNVNAAIGCAQVENLSIVLQAKRELAKNYMRFFDGNPITYIKESPDSKSNYWLNTILLNDKTERDIFLRETNDAGIMTRPVWKLMCDLPMFVKCETDDLSNARYFEERLVNIPSSVKF